MYTIVDRDILSLDGIDLTWEGKEMRGRGEVRTEIEEERREIELWWRGEPAALTSNFT